MLGEEHDDTVPQWLSFTFKKKEKFFLPNLTIQDVIKKYLRRMKKKKTIHHFSRTDSWEVIADIVAPVQDTEGSSQATPGYQVSIVNLVK